MTLFEMLVVVAIISLMAALMMSGSLSALHSDKGAEAVERDFTDWYSQRSKNALYQSQPERLCLTERRVELEVYSRENGWQKSGVFFVPAPGVKIRIIKPACSAVLNAGEDNFLPRIKFYDDE